MSEIVTQQIAELQKEYAQLCHAMQSGVAATYQIEGVEHPKHYRTGINSSIVNNSAMALLLMRKGIITELEYWTAIRDAMKDEVRRYEQDIREKTGRQVTLL